jgi:OmpA-OmpF porin, OOP family
VQVGDIDNLGFGWRDGFDPFSGQSTPRHAYPWRPGADDPAGTDRVMVISGMRDYDKARHDGYSSNTSRPYNAPEAITIKYSLDGITLKHAALQLFVDDFQAAVFGNRFEVRLDGREAPDLAASINALRQTGPIGKLLTLQLLPEYNDLLSDGEVVISIDDPHSNIGDGYAIDFARLLINPKQWQYSGIVKGIAQDKKTRKPLAGVLVTAGNVQQIETDAQGTFELANVPAGLVVTTGTHPDYLGDSQARDLEHGQTINVTLELERNENTSSSMAQQLEAEGKIDLYGIYFDVDKDVLKLQSEATLQQVHGLLMERPTLSVVIAGHTDSEGAADYNAELSRRRAAAVVKWLVEHDIGVERLVPEGMGESQPVADNSTPSGRALNRRVEIRDSARQ